jgi:hypothetical protein
MDKDAVMFTVGQWNWFARASRFALELILEDIKCNPEKARNSLLMFISELMRGAEEEEMQNNSD